MAVKLGKIIKIDPRNVWPNEERHFTPWLAENIALLGEVLGMDLEVTEVESPVGNYSADVLAKDLGSGGAVVIENQYGTTNHDHFGKLLTYASGVDAKTIVWLTQTLRDEHRQALEWLNERTDLDTRFFAIELEVWKIDDSMPAHNFKVVVSPNEWHKRKTNPGNLTPKAEGYRVFFQKLVDELRDKYHFTNAKRVGTDNWYSFSSGFSGIQYSASFATGNRVRVEVYIDRGEQEANKLLFNWLHSRQQQIENIFNEKLTWEKLDDRRASRVAIYANGTVLASEDELANLRTWLVNHLLKIKEVFGPLLKEYLSQ